MTSIEIAMSTVLFVTLSHVIDIHPTSHQSRAISHETSDEITFPQFSEVTQEKMAVVLRSNTDLVYLPDHGFVGEEGGES